MGAKLETAALAGSVVTMADQIMQGIRENREQNKSEAHEHYVKAAIAGAIALGAYKMMESDENAERASKGEEEMGFEPKPPAKPDPHHTRDLIAEAVGAYALGRQMMGHKHNLMLKLIAEGLGAAALARETKKDVVDE